MAQTPKVALIEDLHSQVNVKSHIYKKIATACKVSVSTVRINWFFNGDYPKDTARRQIIINEMQNHIKQQ